MEEVLLVNKDDMITGREEKVQAHLGKGLLHRAFLVMIYDGEGRLMLARRSPDKMLWPGYWDGTVASHPKEGEDYPVAAQRRIRQELGIDVPLPRYLFKFMYHAPYKNIGSEFELCAVLEVKGINPESIKPNPGEIDRVMMTDPGGIFSMELVAPWLLKAEEIRRIESGPMEGKVY